MYCVYGQQMRIKILILVFYIAHVLCFKNWNKPLLLPMRVSCELFELTYPMYFHWKWPFVLLQNQEFGDVHSKMKPSSKVKKSDV